MKRSNWSFEACEWINYRQSLPPFTVNGERCHVIRHCLNGGEVKVKNRKKLYYVDGYCKINNKEYFFEYGGCRWHHCPDCEKGDESRKAPDEEKRQILKSKGVLTSITSCAWLKEKRGVTFKNYTSAFFNHKGFITEGDLLTKIKSGDLFGIVECSVRSSEDVVKRFKSINHPPIFRHVQVTKSMLSDTMKKRVEESKISELNTQLSLTFNADNIMLTTDFIKFYLDQGIEIHDINSVIEFEKDTPLKNFITKVTRKRAEAKKRNDDGGRYALSI